MDFEAACREIGKSLRAISLLILRFLRLDAQGFSDLSQAGSVRESTVLSLRLAAFAFVVAFVAAWIVLADLAPPWATTARSMLKTTAVLAVLLAPVGLAIKLLTRTRAFPIFANLLFVAQGVLTLIMLVGWFLLVLPSEPARTDFPLLRDGMGQNTAAYSVFCSPLERRAETLLLTRETILRTRATAADTRISVAGALADPPKSLAEVRAQIAHAQMVADKLPDAIAFATYNLDRTAQLSSEAATAERDFLEAYPHAFFSAGFVLAGLIIVLLWVVLLSWKLVVWPAPRWKRKLIAVAGVVAGWAGTALIALLLVWWFAPQPLPEMDVEIDGMSPVELSSSVEALELHLGLLEDATALEANKLRRASRELKGFCPTVNNFGLW